MLTIRGIAYIIGFLAILILGVLDLRYREISWQWLYIVIIACGLFTDGQWWVKLICLIVLPLILMECAVILARRKAKKATKKAGLTFSKKDVPIKDAFQYYGGADMLTIASVGFFAGPYWLAAGVVIGILVCSVPFLLKPTMGMKRELAASDDFEKSLPFCFLLAVGMLIPPLVAIAIMIF